MGIDTFFQDHWVEVSPERHEVYERILGWNRLTEELYQRAEIDEGQVVLDLGAGPGHVAMEMARRVGPAGRVHAVDVNAEFLARTRAKAEAEGMGDRVETHLVDHHVLPQPDGSVDRVIAKNTLEYVPGLARTLAECFRVIRPGGRMTATGPDWEFTVIEPWSWEEQRRFFAAGAHAFAEPHVGRKLLGAMLDAGFVDVEVSVVARADRTGAFLGVLRNFVGYIAEFDTMPVDEATAMVDRVEAAVETGRYLIVFPQFSVTGHRSPVTDPRPGSLGRVDP
ncbi:MAG: methyltransferase domain-containing protein [Acidimicrobiales bacterium]